MTGQLFYQQQDNRRVGERQEAELEAEEARRQRSFGR